MSRNWFSRHGFGAVAIAFAVCLSMAVPVSAETGARRIFSEGVLKQIPVGGEVHYSHSRVGTGADDVVFPITGGEVKLNNMPGYGTTTHVTLHVPKHAEI